MNDKRRLRGSNVPHMARPNGRIECPLMAKSKHQDHLPIMSAFLDLADTVRRDVRYGNKLGIIVKRRDI